MKFWNDLWNIQFFNFLLKASKMTYRECKSISSLARCQKWLSFLFRCIFDLKSYNEGIFGQKFYVFHQNLNERPKNFHNRPIGKVKYVKSLWIWFSWWYIFHFFPKVEYWESYGGLYKKSVLNYDRVIC